MAEQPAKGDILPTRNGPSGIDSATATCARHTLIAVTAIGMLGAGQDAHGQARGSSWRLSSAPVLSAGGADGAPAELFTRIAGAARLSDGRFVVADERELRLNVYDASGRFQTAFGRRGEGPGEFLSMRGFWITGGDTIAVWDPRSPRITRFLPNGTVVQTTRPGFSEGSAVPTSPPDPFYGALPDGRIVIAWITFGPRGVDGLQPDRMVFGVLDSNGQLGCSRTTAAASG